MLQVHFQLGHKRNHLFTIFVDLGAAGNFINHVYATQLGVNQEALSQPVIITAVTGWPLSSSPNAIKLPPHRP